MLKVVLGESVAEEPVELVLTERRPHVRWAGELGSGKTVQLRMVARELMDQIPHTKGRLRLVLFDMLEHGADVPDFPKACPELEDLPGVLVVRAGDDVAAAVRQVREELQARGNLELAGAAVEALVIVLDWHSRAGRWVAAGFRCRSLGFRSELGYLGCYRRQFVWNLYPDVAHVGASVPGACHRAGDLGAAADRVETSPQVPRFQARIFRIHPVPMVVSAVIIAHPGIGNTTVS